MRKPAFILYWLILSFTFSFGQNKQTEEQKKHSPGAILKSGKPANAALNSYVGVYRLTTDKTRTITITKENDYLMGEISGQTSLPLVFKSATKFEFEGVTDATCEFTLEKGKVAGIVVFQNGKFIWKKIK